MPGGPQPMERERRLELAYRIAERVQRHYRERTLAVGIYGSLARGSDGPYSDIEMHCVLQGSGIERCHEWSAGPWKAEVNVYSADVVLRWAAEVDVDWSITHGAYTQVLPVHDPTGFFPRLRDTVLSQPDEAFRRAVRDVIVGELYERIGKIRNARAMGNDACLPYLAVDLAKVGACLLGLAHRHLYGSSSRLFPESLTLPHRPDGYDRLCRMVMSGELSDATRVADTSDTFWLGIESWAEAHDLRIEHELGALLEHEETEPDGGP
jgi:kanamycin nucleotidyltransferase